MEYCSVVWSPSYLIHKNRIEKIQRKYIRLLCFKFGIHYDSDNYHLLLSYFSLQSLLNRRKFADIMFVFKVFNRLIDCQQMHELFSVHMPSRILRTTPLLEVEFHRTNYGMHSSATRLSHLTNDLGLTMDILNTSSVAFRSRLRQLLY